MLIAIIITILLTLTYNVEHLFMENFNLQIYNFFSIHNGEL